MDCQKRVISQKKRVKKNTDGKLTQNLKIPQILNFQTPKQASMA